MSKVRKTAYMDRVTQLINEYSRILLVNADHIGSHHMQRIRKNLGNNGVLLMGKNTLIRKAIRENLDQNPSLESLLPHLVGNVGLVFTKEDPHLVRDKLVELQVAAAAKPGTVAPFNIVISKGSTGLEPTKTSFLQALNIPSKIDKGQIEIISDVTVVRGGDKIGPSECALFSLLNIKPLLFTMHVLTVYDNGSVYSSSVLDITNESIINGIKDAISCIASISLGLNIPTLPAFPHMFIGAYKNVLALSVATDYTFKYSEKIKEMIANPEAFAAPVAVQEVNTVSVQEDVKEESEDEEGGDMNLGLFGDDDY